jgi:hypothetical protein
MFLLNFCPITPDDGMDCQKAPGADTPSSMCDDHFAEVAHAYHSPEQVAKPGWCEHCNSMALWAFRYTGRGFCGNCGMSSTPQAAPQVLTRDTGTSTPNDLSRPGAHPEIVYYIRFGDRIKIGTTSNLRQRMLSVYHDEILAVEQGGRPEEAARHRQFARLMVASQREWFHLAPELVAHINALRQVNGPPKEATKRWARGMAA